MRKKGHGELITCFSDHSFCKTFKIVAYFGHVFCFTCICSSALQWGKLRNYLSMQRWINRYLLGTREGRCMCRYKRAPARLAQLAMPSPTPHETITTPSELPVFRPLCHPMYDLFIHLHVPAWVILQTQTNYIHQGSNVHAIVQKLLKVVDICKLNEFKFYYKYSPPSTISCSCVGVVCA